MNVQRHNSMFFNTRKKYFKLTHKITHKRHYNKVLKLKTWKFYWRLYLQEHKMNRTSRTSLNNIKNSFTNRVFLTNKSPNMIILIITKDRDVTR